MREMKMDKPNCRKEAQKAQKVMHGVDGEQL
jgi:hypothetical protein